MPNPSPLSSPSGAEALLSAWEEARPAGAVPVTPALRTAFSFFATEVLSDTRETNLVVADVQDVVSGAAGLAIGSAEASGLGRVQQALREAYLNMQVVGPRTAPNGRILLLVQSRPGTELEMDELTDLTQTLRRNAGMAWEMVFGHGLVPNLPAEIRLAFILAPRRPQ